MEQYNEYCRILGVQPGATAEEIKTAFRSKIKLHHPDRAENPQHTEEARKIIEAYHILKSGNRPRPEFYDDRHPASAQSAHAAHEAGRRAGERIFRAAFKDRKQTIFESVWSTFSEAMLADEEDYEPPPEPKARQYAPHRQTAPRPRSGSLDQAAEYLDRAEFSLRETVKKFNRRTNQSRRQWSKDYIFDLLQVQVLFRDVARRYPVMSGKALNRLRQIQELIVEIKALVV